MLALARKHLNTRPMIIVTLATLLSLSGCRAQTQRATSVTPQSCGSERVLYCVESGSRATDGVCRCLSQEAAQTGLDNL